jgi:putative nucleotidyltransferase with HDIG domain
MRPPAEPLAFVSPRVMRNNEYMPARKSQLKFYKDVELFNKVEGKGFVLYKQSGITLSNMRIHEGIHPGVLYIRKADKLKGLQEAQKGFNSILRKDLRSANHAEVKKILVAVVDETFAEPRSGSLEGVSDTVDILVSEYARQPGVVRSLINLSYTDYSTVLHSINVMAFTLGFCFYMGYSPAKTKVLGLSALLHDIGKTKIDRKILSAPRRLTNEEFEHMKSHTTIGHKILRQCRFSEKDIARCALEHHEKIDGSGYPNSKRDISHAAQVIGMIDCYEALTNDDRPYRTALGVFDTLREIIGRDVKAGKFNKEIYCAFVKSLGVMKAQETGEEKEGANPMWDTVQRP